MGVSSTQLQFTIDNRKLARVLEIFNKAMDSNKSFAQMQQELLDPVPYVLDEFNSSSDYQEYLNTASPYDIAEFISEFFW